MKILINLKTLINLSISKFEKIQNGIIANILYKFLNTFIKIDLFSRKYHIHNFYYNFQKQNLVKAYSRKINYMIECEYSKNSNSQNDAKNYLDIILDEKLIDLLILPSRKKNYLRKRSVEKILKYNNIQFRGSSILLLGPGFSTKDKVDFKSFDFIALNKPLLENPLKIPIHKTIIILNNAWSVGHFKRDTINWITNNNAYKIYSPNKINLDKVNINIFKVKSNYLFASPMGLQRALYILLSDLKPGNITVAGYDFQLGDKPYNSWYPSGLSFFHDSFFEGWLNTNIIHDFLFNFMYVKKLKQQFGNKIYGSIDPYIKMPIEDVITLFEKRMKALRN